MALEMKYFVLKPRNKEGESYDPHAEASRAAMIAYAHNIREYDPRLADELVDWVREEEKHEAEGP